MKKQVLLLEVDDLFDSIVVRERYNPPITSHIIRSIYKQLQGFYFYGLTVAFFGYVNIKKFVNKIRIGQDNDEINIKSIMYKCQINNIECDIGIFTARSILNGTL